MATTPRLVGDRSTPMDAIDEALRTGEKRRRVEIEEEEELREPMAELSVEMQLQLVETVEASQRSVLPSPPARLIESARIWRLIYEAWREDRTAKMESPSKLLSLAQARLFVSPRFKLITSMHWSAASQILEAHAAILDRDADPPEPFPVLALYRARFVSGDRGQWMILSLIKTVDREEETRDGLAVVTAITFDVHHLTRIEGGSVSTLALVKRTTRFSELGTFGSNSGSTDRVELEDVLIYNRGRAFLGPTAYAKLIIPDILGAMMSRFMLDYSRFERPTPGMLSWKNSVILVHASAMPVLETSPELGDRYHGDLRVDMYFLERSSESGEEEKVTVRVSVSPAMTIAGLNGTAIGDAIKTLSRKRSRAGLGPGPARIQNALYRRTEVVWVNDALMPLFDSRKLGSPGGAFELPPTGNAREILRARAETIEEPALESLAEYDEWGYAMTKFLPPIREMTAGMLIMPVPWFFFFARNALSNDTIVTSSHIFLYQVNTITSAILDSSHVLAHQPYEMIFLPDDIEGADLNDLTMLQRRNIKERATAPLVEEVAEGIELL